MKQSKQTTGAAPERGADVIKRALEIMAQGHYGWSWALEQAANQLAAQKASGK